MKKRCSRYEIDVCFLYFWSYPSTLWIRCDQFWECYFPNPLWLINPLARYMTILNRCNLSFSLPLKHEIGGRAHPRTLSITLDEHSVVTHSIHRYVVPIHLLLFPLGFPNNLKRATLQDSHHSHFHHPGSIPARRSCIFIAGFVSICFWSP